MCTSVCDDDDDWFSDDDYYSDDDSCYIGGWDLSNLQLNQEDLGRLMQIIMANRPGFPPDQARDLANVCYLYDTALARNQGPAARALLNQYLSRYDDLAKEKMRKVFHSVRRRIHTYGGPRPHRKTREEQEQAKRDSYQFFSNRSQPWPGSSQFTQVNYQTHKRYLPMYYRTRPAKLNYYQLFGNRPPAQPPPPGPAGARPPPPGPAGAQPPPPGPAAASASANLPPSAVAIQPVDDVDGEGINRRTTQFLLLAEIERIIKSLPVGYYDDTLGRLRRIANDLRKAEQQGVYRDWDYLQRVSDIINEAETDYSTYPPAHPPTVKLPPPGPAPASASANLPPSPVAVQPVDLDTDQEIEQSDAQRVILEEAERIYNSLPIPAEPALQQDETVDMLRRMINWMRKAREEGISFKWSILNNAFQILTDARKKFSAYLPAR